MASQNETSSKERTPMSRGALTLWLGCAVLCVVVGVAVFGDRGMIRAYHVYHQKRALEDQILQLKKESQGLREEISRLKDKDSPYLEHVARTQLGMVRDNELVYQISKTPR